MKTLTALSVWLWAERLRARRRPPANLIENRRRLIERLAPGKSFLDAGGMWGVNGEIAFLAEAAGATDVLLADGMDPTPEFQAEHEQRGSRLRYAQFDLHDLEGVEELGSFDVVYCAGVIYHSPNPFLLLQHLRRATRETLILSSRIIPEVPGVEQACVWYPGISEKTQRAFTAFHGNDPGLLGVSAPYDDSPGMAYANYFWGITRSALRAMLRVAEFELIEEHSDRFLMDVVARPIARESAFPAVDFSRRRDHDRRAAMAEDAPPWLTPRPRAHR